MARPVMSGSGAVAVTRPLPSSSSSRRRQRTLAATVHATRISFFLSLAFFAAGVVGQDGGHSNLAASSSPSSQKGVAGTGSEKALGSHANIVDMAISLASVLGCLIIIVPYVLRKHSRKLRHSLIVGLATSDLVSALTIVASTSYLLDGGNLIEASRFCTFLGFALSSSTYTQHMWNLCILVITYMILVHPLSRWTAAIEKHILWLWPIIWLLAMGLNGFAWGFAGFGYSGGYCYLGMGAGSDFVYLFPLIPRCIVVGITLVLYTRLFFFLRRTNLFNKTGSTRSASVARSIRSGRRDTPPRIMGEYDASEEAKTDEAPSSETNRAKFYLPFLRMNGIGGGGASTRAGSETSQSRSPTSLFKSRKLSGPSPTLLPIEMRDYAMGAPPGSAPASTGNLPHTINRTSSLEPPLSPKSTGPAGQPQGDPFDRLPSNYLTASPGGGDEATAPPRRSRSLSMINMGRSVDDNVGGVRTGEDVAPDQIVPSSPSLQRSNTNTSSSREPLFTGSSSGPASPTKDESIDSSDDEIPDYNTWAGLAPMKPRRDTRDFKMVTAPREHLRHFAIKGMSKSGKRPSTAPASQQLQQAPPTPTMAAVEHAPLAVVGGQTNSIPSSRRPSAPSEIAIAIPAEHAQAPPSRGSAAAYETAMGDDWTWGMDVTRAAGGRRGSVMPSQLRSASKERRSTLKPNGGRLTSSGGRRGSSSGAAGQSSHTSSSTDEHGVENMGSTLNRQASALLLLYPLAYIILFSISLARLIRDLVSARHRATTQDTLNNIARWLILAQGALDCIIFKVIEQQFRMRMKRKRARARGEDPGRTSVQRVGGWAVDGAKRMLRRGTKVWGSSSREKEEIDFRRPSGGV